MAHRYRIINGGLSMDNTVALLSCSKAAVDTSVVAKNDWDELCEWGTSEALRIGWTEKDSEELLLQVRNSTQWK